MKAHPVRAYQLVILICALLSVQFGAQLHGLEHWSHSPEQSCQVYFAAERLGHALPMALPVLPPLTSRCIVLPRPSRIFPTSTFTSFHARAPPLF
jgi:hypothetical protein